MQKMPAPQTGLQSLSLGAGNLFSKEMSLGGCCGTKDLKFPKGDVEMVMANKADWSRARSEWCGQPGVANGILRRPRCGEKLRDSAVRANRLFSLIRCQLEKVLGLWKRSTGYRRVR
jgi:hypothetical protein